MKLEDLDPKLQEKARSCTSPAELLAIAAEEGYELSDEELDGVAGGWCSSDCSSHGECGVPFWR